jgi:hypothetical protein
VVFLEKLKLEVQAILRYRSFQPSETGRTGLKEAVMPSKSEIYLIAV